MRNDPGQVAHTFLSASPSSSFGQRAVALCGREGNRTVRGCWNRYLCGIDYFERGHRIFPSRERCSDCMVVHNNWIVSREAKIYRFKEHFMWMYDKDSYYR